MRATTAIHPVAGDASALLRRAGAPDDLVEAAAGAPLDRLWDDCGRADWLLWLAVVEKIPLRAMVDAVGVCVRLAVDALRGDVEPMEAALAAVHEMRSASACAQAAEACDRIAAGREAPGYRAAAETPHAQAAKAAAHLARAAEALVGAEGRRVAARDAEGRARAAGIGVGDQIMWHADLPPLGYDLEDELLNGSIFALEAALTATARSLLGPDAAPEAAAEVASELADAAFEVLDPVREGLRQGRDPRALVRRVDVLPYVESKDPVDNPKKPLAAAATALIFPFGGGHYHANHRYVGWMLSAGTVAALALGHGLAIPLMVAADAALAPRAVRRRNRGECMRPPDQLALGAVIVAVAHAIAAIAG